MSGLPLTASEVPGADLPSSDQEAYFPAPRSDASAEEVLGTVLPTASEAAVSPALFPAGSMASAGNANSPLLNTSEANRGTASNLSITCVEPSGQ